MKQRMINSQNISKNSPYINIYIWIIKNKIKNIYIYIIYIYIVLLLQNWNIIKKFFLAHWKNINSNEKIDSNEKINSIEKILIIFFFLSLKKLLF